MVRIWIKRKRWLGSWHMSAVEELAVKIIIIDLSISQLIAFVNTIDVTRKDR